MGWKPEYGRTRDLEKKRANDAAYRLRHRESIRAYHRERYQRQPHEYVERALRWAKAHPEQTSAYARVKNLRRRSAPLDAEARAYVALLATDPCAYCGVAPGSEIDHIEPISKGGTSEWQNLTAACRSCNAAKSGRPMLLFLATRPAA